MHLLLRGPGHLRGMALLRAEEHPATRARLVHNPVANVSSLATGLCDTAHAPRLCTGFQVGQQSGYRRPGECAHERRVQARVRGQGAGWALGPARAAPLARSTSGGDTLVVWKLDRLSRSLKDLLHILERVEAVGARFRSLTEAIDTSGPAGRMLMQMLGSFAEFERAMVRERTRAGLKAATARGRNGGRQPKLTPEQKTEILDGLGSGRKSAADLARLFGCTGATISRLAAQMRADAPGEGLA